jgi:hypothetical protein
MSCGARRLLLLLLLMSVVLDGLTLLLGDFVRVLRSHGIATIFHAGKIDPINGVSTAASLRAAVEQFGRRQRLSADYQDRIVHEVAGKETRPLAH